MPTKKPFTKAQELEIASEYISGSSSVQIGKKYAMSPVTVARILRDCGTPMRSISESASLRAGKAVNGDPTRGIYSVFQSKKSGKWIPAASTYEYMRLQQLEDDKSVIFFDRCKTRVAYEFNGKQHHYTPDFIVVNSSGVVRVEEIKPCILTTQAKNVAKADAAMNHFETLGFEYVFVTEHVIGSDYIAAFDWSGIAGICQVEIKKWQIEQDRKRRREWASRNYKKNPPTPEQLAAHNNKQKERYKRWKESATADEILERRRKGAEIQARMRAKNRLQ